MGLLDKLFRARERSGEPESQFHESETTAPNASPAGAPRRELVHLVMRDTMRHHGIPSDWIDCRILSVVTREQKAGMHVQFIVRQGEQMMLAYVHPFQDTFWKEMAKFDPHAPEWLFSLAWQFDGGAGAAVPTLMAGADGWSKDTQPPDHHPDTQPPDNQAEELESDLQALYAIRDAAISPAGGPAADPAAAPAPDPARKPPARR